MLYIKTVKGHNIRTDDWLSINEPIAELSVQINEKEFLVLEGFESYLRLKENFLSVNSSNQGISKIILLGKSKTNVAKITLDLIHSKICQEVVPFDKAYQEKPLNPSLWKKGLLHSPKVYIKKI